MNVIDEAANQRNTYDAWVRAMKDLAEYRAILTHLIKSLAVADHMGDVSEAADAARAAIAKMEA